MKYLSTFSFFLAGSFWFWFGYRIDSQSFPVFLFLTSIILAYIGFCLANAIPETKEGDL